jgi:hypothetical protein
MAKRISDEAVTEKTGRTWGAWFTLLDEAGAAEMSHPEIARYLQEKEGIDGWWSQSVTVEYEKARGRRAEHEKAGGFEVSAGKTVGVPIEVLFEAWNDAEQRAQWLARDEVDFHRATPHKSMRGTWNGESRLDVGFYPKGEGKSQVTLQHGKLPDAEEAERMKAFWRAKVEELKTWLEGR